MADGAFEVIPASSLKLSKFTEKEKKITPALGAWRAVCPSAGGNILRFYGCYKIL